MKYVYLLQEIIKTMNDRIMTSSGLDFSFNFFLYFALPVSANLYLQIECLTFERHLYIGNAFRCTGLAPHPQTAVILALRVLPLVKCSMNLSPRLNAPG